MRLSFQKILIIAGLTGGLSACDPSNVSTSLSVGVGTSGYYDSMMWNDYYYRPPRPGPRPPPPGVGPGRPRPLPARPPIHRPGPRPR